MVSQLEETKSMRRYNSLKRAMTGTIFRYQGKSFVLSSLLSKGLYSQTFGQGKKKPSRTVPKPQMSTWQALASLFLPNNEEPAPTTQADKHTAPLNQLTNTPPRKNNPLPPTSTTAKTNSLNSTPRHKQVHQCTCPVAN